MGKLSKTLTILGGTVLAGVAYSLWKDKKDLEEENEELYGDFDRAKVGQALQAYLSSPE